MPLNIIDNGGGHTVEIDPEVVKASSGTVVLQGRGNRIIIETGCTLHKAYIVLDNAGSFHAAANCRLAMIEAFSMRGGHVAIGPDCGFTAQTKLLLHEKANITIGRRCLIAGNTILSVTDMHSIMDMHTGERLNPAADVTLEDHVWLGGDAKVLKGVRIGHDSVIGTGAIVTKSIPANCVAVGIPARVVREGVTWSQSLV